MSSAPRFATSLRQAEADVADDVALDLVGAAAEGHHQGGPEVALEAAGQHRALGGAGDAGVGADDLHQRPVDLGGQLGAVDLGGRGLGGGEVDAGVRVGGELPVDQAERLDPGVRPTERDLHPLGVGDALAVGVLGLLRPLAHQLQRLHQRRRRGEGDPLVVELVGHQRPAAVELADQVADRHPHVLVVRRAGADAGHRVHGRVGDAGRLGGHQDHREALVAGEVGVGAAGQPDPVGVLDQRGPHLLAVDHPLVALAGGLGLQRRQVGARAGLGVADREVQVAGEDLREEELLLLVGAVAHDRRPDRVERQVGDRHPGHGRGVGEDQLLDHRARLAAVLLGPADAQPAVGPDLPDHFLVDPGLAELSCRRGQPGLTLGSDELVEVLLELCPQGEVLGIEGYTHGARLERVLVFG